jgi:MFS family permease
MSAAVSAAPHAPALRWWILAFISLALFGNYYVYDSIAPVADLLQQGLGFSDTELGTLNAIYSLPNIVLVLVGGMLADRYGAAWVSCITAGLCLLGALLTVMADGFVVMALGRLLFGVGAETMIVATMIPLARWFSGRSIAFAMALALAVARLGSYAADLSPTWAGPAYASGWQTPLWIAAAISAIGFVATLAYALAERGRIPPDVAARGAEPPFAWRDVWRFDRSYWYVVALCVLFYSSVFPFRTFSILYFQHASGLPLAEAGQMNSNLPLAAVIATPLFGLLSDRYGHRAGSLVLGAALLAAAFALLATMPQLPLAAMLLLGVAFALVPAVLWPAVSFLAEPRRLGTAFGLMTMLQNIGLTLSNMAAGTINDQAGAGADNPGGYLPMLVYFALLAAGGVVFALLLWRRERGPQGHGMEGRRPAAA